MVLLAFILLYAAYRVFRDPNLVRWKQWIAGVVCILFAGLLVFRSDGSAGFYCVPPLLLGMLFVYLIRAGGRKLARSFSSPEKELRKRVMNKDGTYTPLGIGLIKEGFELEIEKAIKINQVYIENVKRLEKEKAALPRET